MYNDELMHYGVLGMKWGVRKAVRTDSNVRSAKSDYKNAKKAYSKSFNKAYRNSSLHPITQFATKKGRAKSDALWEQANRDAQRTILAKTKYKSAQKKARNGAAKSIKGGYTAEAKRNIANMSTGKAVAQSFLMGSYGAAVYSNARTKGMSRGKAASTAVLANWGNNMTLGALSRAAKRSQ